MEKKIVIIGGGVAGLSAGIYGQLNGFRTEIIEMHTTTGGQCTAWDRKGYRFDYCLHWLVGTSKGAFHDVWKETNVLNEKTVVVDHDVYVKMVNANNESFYIYADIDRWEKYLLELAPEDARGIKKMCREMRLGILLEPFSKPAELLTVVDYIKALFKMFPVLKLMFKFRNMTCTEYFNKLKLKNNTLKTFLNSFYGDRDFSATAFLLMLAFFNQKNAGYIKGGSLPLAQRMTDKFVSIGGTLTTGCKVTKIITDDGRAKAVELENGRTITADYIISAADGYQTLYGMLGGKYLTKQIENAYNEWELFMPLVQISFGINTIIPTSEPVTSYLAAGRKIGSTALPFGYSVMNYSFDTTMAPEGKSVVIIRFETPWKVWATMGKEQYKIEKENILADALAIMETHYQGFRQYVEVTDVATPLTDVRYTGVWQGAYEGFMPTSTNFNKNLNMRLPGLQNFFMAGQWLFPGGGLPPSAQSGKSVIQLICKDEKKKFRTIQL
ncbi:MAG: NAD(P)/FAD-dependent oxidoreductase [Bacteroidota bacterium]